MTAVPYRSSFAFAAALALCLASACKHDTSNSIAGPASTSSNGLTVAIDSGSNLQIAVAGKTIHVIVHANNADGSPAVGQTATWSVVTGGGSVAPGASATDATGHTGTDWTLGTTAGTNSLNVTIAGAVISLTATGAADQLKSLAKVTADGQTVVASSSTGIVVRAVDQYGNPVPGVTVTWSASGGTFAPATTVTGDAGNAQITFTTAAAPARYSITASAAGVSPVTFTVTGS